MKVNTKTKQLCWAATLLVFCACTQKMALQGRGSPNLVRKPPDGTIARGQLIKVSRSPLTLGFLKRGRTRFDINCTPCHGYAGYGDGILPQRGFLPPPSYHTDRLRNASDQHFFDVMTKGFGAMYSYADRLDETDRWAVVAYIRALQLSQNPKLGVLSPEERIKIEKEDP